MILVHTDHVIDARDPDVAEDFIGRYLMSSNVLSVEEPDQFKLASHLVNHFVRSGRWENLGKLIQLGDELEVPPSTVDWWRIQLGAHLRDETAIAAAAARSGRGTPEDHRMAGPEIARAQGQRVRHAGNQGVQDGGPVRVQNALWVARRSGGK